MADPYLRNLLLQSQPDVYRADDDTAAATARAELRDIATTHPHAVLEVLLEDLMWRVALERFASDDDTPSLDQIMELALRGDFELAHERTELAYNLERDRALLLKRFKQAADAALSGTDTENNK